MVRDGLVRAGKRGTVVIPASLRRRLGIGDGTLLTAKESDGGILLQPAFVRPRFTDAERKAFWDEVDAGYERMRTEYPEEWEAMLAEQREWDATLMDGLEDEPPYPLDDIDAAPPESPA